jgi:predicted CoA-substrate-specific enzyme activase
MSIRLGIDIGAVGIKAALVLASERVEPILAREGARELLGVLGTPTADGQAVLVAKPRRTRGRPLDTAGELLEAITTFVPVEQIAQLGLTGSGGAMVAEVLDASICNEFQACTRAIDALHRHVRTVFEIGGEASRYIRCEPDPASGVLGILDYGTNGDCAAGTGAFLDQQASRLQFAVEDIGDIVAQAERAAQIAGRCSVFAKSDMIHAQQKGYGPAEVLRGLCNAVARNFRTAVVRGRTPVAPIALVGGVSANTAVVQALHEIFELSDGELFVPEAAESLGAVGAALLAGETAEGQEVGISERLRRLRAASEGDGYAFPTMRPLSMERVKLLRSEAKPYEFPRDKPVVDAYLGLDIGSVGTKLVLIDEQGEVIHSIFTRTEGRPIEVVSRCLRETEAAVGWGVRIRAVGSTGSGRELIGELVGADGINDEITAHKTGATFVGDRLLGKRPDTIFEIGGQDSKYISLQPESGAGDAPADGQPTETIVVDFTMNEACAAGTGSFLEERAEELGISIKNQFAELALSSAAPLRLGERCTVFMERDVNTYMQRGAKREDVIAGLAYSIAYNYINRVVRGRPIGDCVFFQGGTAYNDAVAAAFSMITGKEIIVPPHNALLGAIGAALLAKEKVKATSSSTRFRGYDLAQVDYTLREFTCKGCGNHCAIQEFNVAGEKTFWGDKCSDRYRKQVKTQRKPVIPDLVTLRQQLLEADDSGDPPGATATVGIPRAMYTHDLLPLWRRFFRECGLRVVLSHETNRPIVQMGLDRVVAEPCFPIIVAHGHVADLAEQGVDYIWLPSIISSETDDPDDTAYVCPWGQTLPFVVRQAPALRAWQDRILCPCIRFKDGIESVKRALVRVVKHLGVRRGTAERAFAAGWAALQQFRTAYAQAGREALETLRSSGEPGMVLVGRPYNIHDLGVSLSTAKRLRERYGVNVLPIDALPLDGIDISDVNDNMYWAYGRRILAAARLVGQHQNLHIIYITNFKCGPDSFLKGFIRSASGKPFLSLQFDGHSNDAGTMTRCEAYLDSKGILRWWRTSRSKPVEQVLKGAPSTSRKCPTPLPG